MKINFISLFTQRRFAFVFLGFCLVLPPIGSQPLFAGTVQGSVQSESGEPLKDAVIHVTRVKGKKFALPQHHPTIDQFAGAFSCCRLCGPGVSDHAQSKSGVARDSFMKGRQTIGCLRTMLLLPLGIVGTWTTLPFAQGAPFREYPIGEEVERNNMKIAAVWLPPIQMEGMEVPEGEDIIHLEADIHAIRGNENGFGIGEWIPYFTVNYTLVHIQDERKITGQMIPMVAKDGPHYGATIQMPAHGEYRLTYEIRPPSENGFGRHMDMVTGVAPWWEPFSVEFTFQYEGVPQ